MFIFISNCWNNFTKLYRSSLFSLTIDFFITQSYISRIIRSFNNCTFTASGRDSKWIDFFDCFRYKKIEDKISYYCLLFSKRIIDQINHHFLHLFNPLKTSSSFVNHLFFSRESVYFTLNCYKLYRLSHLPSHVYLASLSFCSMDSFQIFSFLSATMNWRHDLFLSSLDVLS